MMEMTILITELSYVLEYVSVILYSWMLVKSRLLYVAYLIVFMLNVMILLIELPFCANNWMPNMLSNDLKVARLTRYLKVNMF